MALMSKKSTEAPAPEPHKPAQAVARAEDVPAYLAAAAEADAGLGVSTAAADNIIPLIYVMQPLSPQVDEAAPAYVPGARAGSFWLRNCATPIVGGDAGILVQPVRFTKDWGEWVPRERGGGMMGRHPNRAATPDDVGRLGDRLVEGEDVPDCPGASFRVDPTTRQKIWSVKRGEAANDLVHTRNHAVRVFLDERAALPYVIPLKGTGHGVSKEWMGKMMVKRAGNRLMPSFACLYRLTTRQRQNVKGKWWQIVVSDAGYVSPDDYAAGKALYEAFETEAVVAEAEVAGAGAPEGGADAAGSRDGEHIPF